MTATPTRPVLRYHGGKWLLAPWIIEHFPNHRTYVEPFGGAASVLIRKEHAYAEVYNDLDGEIVNLFRVLRDAEQAAELEYLIRHTPFSRVEFVQSYEPSSDPVEQARRTMFRSFAGLSGVATSGKPTGFRSDVTRSGTIPATDWMRLPNQIPALVARLQGVIIECDAAADVIRRYDSPDTLFYIDPPYPAETRDAGRDYRFEMDTDDHRKLASILHDVTGMVVLSGYPCRLYDDLYAGWKRVERSAYADGASPRREALWLSPSVVERLKFQTIQLKIPSIEGGR